MPALTLRLFEHGAQSGGSRARQSGALQPVDGTTHTVQTGVRELTSSLAADASDLSPASLARRRSATARCAGGLAHLRLGKMIISRPCSRSLTCPVRLRRAPFSARAACRVPARPLLALPARTLPRGALAALAPRARAAQSMGCHDGRHDVVSQCQSRGLLLHSTMVEMRPVLLVRPYARSMKFRMHQSIPRSLYGEAARNDYITTQCSPVSRNNVHAGYHLYPSF